MGEYRRSEKYWYRKKIVGGHTVVSMTSCLAKHMFLMLTLFGIAFHLIFSNLVNFLVDIPNSIQSFNQLTSIIYLVSILGVSWIVSKEISKKYVYKWTLSYLLYCLGSYVIYVTRNLNNYELDWRDFLGNQFFQLASLPSVAIILFLSYSFRCFQEKKHITFVKTRRFPTALYGLLGISFLLDRLSIEVFFRLYQASFSDVGTVLTSDFIPRLFGLFVIYNILIKFLVNGGKDFIRNKSSFSLIVLTSLFMAIVFNYTLQYGVRTDESLMEMYIFPGATAYQIILLFLLSLIVYVLVNRVLLATLLIATFWSSVSIISAIKMSMRNEPMLFTDFSWVKDIALVTNFVSTRQVVVLLSSFMIAFLLYVFLFKKLFTGKIFVRLSERLIALSLVVSIVMSGYMIFKQEKNRLIPNGVPILSQLNNNYNMHWLASHYHARYRSLLFVWTKQLTSELMVKPNDYNKERLTEIYEKYKLVADEINKDRKTVLSEQTVIFLLSESFADPERLEGVTVSEEIISNVKGFIDKNTSGTMKSDTYGGGTANIEWQTLVGLPMSNLSDGISSINTEVVPKMSIVPSISDSYGKTDRLTIHLGDAMTYSRRLFYLDRLKFEEFVATKNGTETVDDFYRLGLFPSDDSTYKTVLNKIDSSKNQFLSVISYQNHIPYSLSTPEEIVATSDFLNAEENDSLTSYARLMYHTDLETQKFLDSLRQLDKKITVVFYGDHLPGFYSSSQFSSNPESQYETDYFIWTNTEEVKKKYPYIKASDLPAVLLAHTNSKVSPYYALLTEILEKVSSNKEDLSETEELIKEELALVQYDLISGKGYLSQMEDFFLIP